MKPTTEHAEHTDPATPLKEPGGHPVLTALAMLAVGAATAFFLHLRAPLRRLAEELVLNWGTGPRTPGDWALLVPTWAVVCIAAGIVGILLVAFLMRKGALALSLAALVAAPFFLAFAILSLHAATFLPLSDAFQSMAKAASATAPALLPEPLSAVRLGMTESELLAARPAAQRDEYQPWPGIVELEERFTDGPFQSAAYTLADVPDGAGTLDGVLLFSGEPTENTTTNAAFAAVLAEAKSRLGPAPRRFELIPWGVAFDVHAWETNGTVAACLTISRALDPDACATAADGRFFFLAFRREAAERMSPMRRDLGAILAAALDRPVAEDGRPVAWADPLPATNRIDQYLADGRPVASRERGDAVLALVSDYGSFPFSVERDDFAIGETHAGFVEIRFSGRGIDIDDPHAIFVSLDGSKLRVDDADYLLFSVPEDRRAAMRDAVAPLVRAEKTHAESAEPEPHAESADSPLATALAGGEWIPLVVESVYIDATAPRELRKNWIVSFSGGIKARVHSPVKTFGESYGDLPGKRFGVRFVDRAAALAALHGTVYSGELEVRSAQGPVSAAANAAAEKEAAVRAKLDAIVFDSLEYQDANAADVISDLCERAREMDKDEPDPAKKGVSVVVGVDVKDIDEILARTTVTLKERSVSLGAALDRVADAIGLKVRVVGGCVLLGIYKGPLECRIFPVPPDLASRFLGDGNDWKARLAEIGIEWPDGTYVRYLMSVGRLTVYNTPDDLDRIERALAEAAPSPAEETHAESAEGAEPESHAESAECVAPAP